MKYRLYRFFYTYKDILYIGRKRDERSNSVIMHGTRIGEVMFSIPGADQSYGFSGFLIITEVGTGFKFHFKPPRTFLPIVLNACFLKEAACALSWSLTMRVLPLSLYVIQRISYGHWCQWTGKYNNNNNIVIIIIIIIIIIEELLSNPRSSLGAVPISPLQ